MQLIIELDTKWGTRYITAILPQDIDDKIVKHIGDDANDRCLTICNYLHPEATETNPSVPVNVPLKITIYPLMHQDRPPV